MAQMDTLADIAARWQVNTVIIEKNMGHGAFAAVWLPILRLKHACQVLEDYVHGQKELRIIETIEPVIARGALIWNEEAIEEDRETSMAQPSGKRGLFSIFHQLGKITRDRNCLAHDDRADALEGAVRHWVALLAINQDHAVKKQREREAKEALIDPLNHLRHSPPTKRGGSLFN
jgi:hypothetical protein